MRVWSRLWGKAIVVLAGLGLLGIFLIWLLFARGLPSVDKLRAYEPPLPTYVRGINGEPIHSYARERRVELSYDEFPPLMVKAILAAEDRPFSQHHGVDLAGIANAAWTNPTHSGRPTGASPVPQQLAHHLLLGNQNGRESC